MNNAKTKGMNKHNVAYLQVRMYYELGNMALVQINGRELIVFVVSSNTHNTTSHTRTYISTNPKTNPAI